MRIAGLGSIPAAGWRPTRGWEVARYTVGQRVPVTAPAIRSVVDDAQRRTARALFTPAFAVETCGQPGGLPCAAATPQSALKGLSGLGNLGLVNVTLCSPFEAAIDALGQALERAQALNIVSADVAQARTRYDAETSLLLWRRTQVFFGNCETRTRDIQQLITAVNADIAKAGGKPVLVPQSIVDETKPPEPSETASTIKTVAIAAGVIAGVVVLAPLVWEGVAWAKVARKTRKK